MRPPWMMAWCLAGLAGCGAPEPPAEQSFEVTVDVRDERGVPLPGATVRVDRSWHALTGPSGRVAFRLRGRPDTDRRLDVEPPPAYQVEGASSTQLALRLGQPAADRAPGPLAISKTFTMHDQRREVLLAVVADCDAPAEAEWSCADVTVHVDGRPVAKLDAEGRAFAPLWVIRNVPVDVMLAPPAGVRLGIERPATRFVPTARGQVLLMRRAGLALKAVAHAEEVEASGPFVGAGAAKTIAKADPTHGQGPGVARPKDRPRSSRPPVSRPDRVPRVASGGGPTNGPIEPFDPPRGGSTNEALAVAGEGRLDPPATPEARDDGDRVEPVEVPATVRCQHAIALKQPLSADCRRIFAGIDSSEGGDYVEARRALLVDAHRRGRWSEVIDQGEALRAIGGLHNDPELHLLEGQALIKLARYDRACEALGRAERASASWQNRLRGERVLVVREALAYAWTRRALARGADPSARDNAIRHWSRAEMAAIDVRQPKRAETARAAREKLENE